MVGLLLYGYFANRPKGSRYEVPDQEAGFNVMLGIVTLVIYLLMLIPINIFMRKRSEISAKIYTVMNIIATILGFIVFWILLDKRQKLF